MEESEEEDKENDKAEDKENELTVEDKVRLLGSGSGARGRVQDLPKCRVNVFIQVHLYFR